MLGARFCFKQQSTQKLRRNNCRVFADWLYNSRMDVRHAAMRSTSAVCVLLPAMFAPMRPMSSLVAGTMSSAVFLMHSGFSGSAILVGLAMFTLTSFGFVFNDILDYHKDAAANVKRPIASGILSRKVAMLFALVLLVTTCTVSFLVGSGGQVLVMVAVALILYTPFAHKFPLMKGLYVAVLCAAPLYYGSFVSRARYAWPSYVTLALFVAGREALMDANEVEGDLRAGMLTIAVALGDARARRIGTYIMALSLGVGVIAATGWAGKVMFLVALFSLLGVFSWPKLNDTRRIELSRLPMLAAAFAIARG